MTLEKLSGLSLLSAENEQARNFDFRKFIQQFASTKTKATVCSISGEAVCVFTTRLKAVCLIKHNNDNASIEIV